GSLRNYLNTNVKLSWFDKINNLFWIAGGLNEIHANGIIHRDLHISNILHRNVKYFDTCITDMGICKPADYIATENTKNSTYGVLPYIAPEILRGQNYTKAADIYSFGIIMYEVI
ncbi:kinase-like domain-containing protein, partial [Glomus cerebriforme]